MELTDSVRVKPASGQELRIQHQWEQYRVPAEGRVLRFYTVKAALEEGLLVLADAPPVVEPEEDLACPECGKPYRNAYWLERHMNSQHGGDNG